MADQQDAALKVGLLQARIDPDPTVNRSRLEAYIRTLADNGASLIVLPELHESPYFCQVADPDNFSLAEPIPGPATDHYAALAAELGIVLVVSVFEDRGNGIYHNTAVVLDHDRGLVGLYRKMHIPDDPGYHEKYYFRPGDTGFHPVDTSIGRLGILICWDQWFPEAARLMSLAGADLLIYPTAIGWDSADTEQTRENQRNAWITIQRSHAIANGLPVISVNRVGHEPDPSGNTDGQRFWGSSFVVNPEGHIDLMSAIDDEACSVCTIDLQSSRQIRRIWPFHRDRRTDEYQDLLRTTIP